AASAAPPCSLGAANFSRSRPHSGKYRGAQGAQGRVLQTVAPGANPRPPRDGCSIDIVDDCRCPLAAQLVGPVAVAVGMLVLVARGATQVAVEVGVRFLEVADDLEVDTLDLRQVDLFDVHQPEQLAHRLRHLAPAFIARAAALGDADLGPELFLIETESAPDLARIEDAFEKFHVALGL